MMRQFLAGTRGPASSGGVRHERQLLCKTQKVDHSKDSAHIDLERVRLWSARNGEEDLSPKVSRHTCLKLKLVLFAP